MKKQNILKAVLSILLILAIASCASLSSRGEKVKLVPLDAHTDVTSCEKYKRPMLDVVGESRNEVEEMPAARHEKLFRFISDSIRNEAGKQDLNLCISDMKLHIFQHKLKTEAEMTSILQSDPLLQQVYILAMVKGHSRLNTVYMSATCYRCPEAR